MQKSLLDYSLNEVLNELAVNDEGEENFSRSFRDMVFLESNFSTSIYLHKPCVNISWFDSVFSRKTMQLKDEHLH